MPKGPDDETKMRTEDIDPSALRHKTHAAAADGPRPSFQEIPAALAPAPSRKRGGGLLVLLLLVVIAAIAATVWYFFFR
jgi:hypothetical protein